MRTRLAVFLLAFLAASSPRTAAAQAPANAADEYDRIAALLGEIDPGQDGPWSDPDGSSFAPFMQRGEIDARMQRWLAAARPLVGQLAAAADLAYDRGLDRSQGFSLLLPHLSRQRMIVRSLDVLLVDAQYGDRASCADILRAQAAIAGRTASDGLLVSSLVAMGCGQMSRTRLVEMINCGAVDAALAREALAATDPIDGRDALRLGDAVETEHAALTLEIGKVAAAQGEDRTRRIAELTGLMGEGARAMPLTDEALAAFPAQADAYRAAARAVVDAPTREAAMKAVDELSQAVGSGAYGEILKSFAPALDRVVERAWTYEEGWASLRADLAALADGSKTPEDLMDAAFHYFRAAAAAEQVAAPDQAEFDALRLAGGFLDAETRANGKSRLARLERAITAEVYRGSRLGRLRLDWTTLRGREISAGEGLVRATQPGINGAVRTMLAAAVTDDAVTKVPLEKPIAGPQELAVAAVRVAAHYASTGQYGHSLAALAMLRDAGDAIDLLARAGRFDADGKALLLKALAKLDGADPIGLSRATDAERTLLGQHFSDAIRLARLAPAEVAALVAANAPAERALDPLDCACPDHGAMLDMRPWFSADALAKAKASHERLEARRAKARGDDRQGLQAVRLEGSPLEGVEAAPPFDLEAARESARSAVDRLRRLAE
ncbi:MAG: hypothetical protein RL325_505 [Planctomycetota bacterium]|jgi:hypothetical protein